MKTPTYIALFLSSFCLILGSKEPVRDTTSQTASKEAQKASAYWLSNKKIVLHYLSHYHLNGVLARTRKYRISAQEDKLYNGSRVQVLKYEFLLEPKDKAPYYSAQYLYDIVDDNSITNVAYQSGEAPPEPEKYPGPDLKSPIQKGTSWSGKNLDTVLTDQLKDPILMTYTLTIEDVRRTVTIAAGTFKGCVVVKQTGISTEDVKIRCKDGSASVCKVFVERRRYYYHGYGCIKEEAETHYSSSSENQKDCVVTSWSSELVEISNIKTIGA